MYFLEILIGIRTIMVRAIHTHPVELGNLMPRSFVIVGAAIRSIIDCIIIF